MKKAIIALSLVLAFSGVSFAAEAPATDSPVAEASAPAKKAVKKAPKKAAKKAPKKAPKAAATAAQPE
jgi:hypothetical protein